MEKTYNLENLTKEKNDYDFYKSFSNGELVDAASDIKYSNLLDKINYIFIPGIVSSEKEIARKILEERGVDWKIRQVDRHNAIKRANKIYWDNTKKELTAPWIALCKTFYNILKTYLYKK